MKKGILSAVILVSALFLPVMVKASELTDDYYDIAANYFNSNNLTKSLEYLDLILMIEPDNTCAKELRAKISPPPLDKEAEAQTTASVLNKTQEPKNVVIVEAPRINTELITYDSDYYNRKGQEFYQKQDFNSAVEYFYKAVALNSKNAQAYNNLAMTYWCKGNTEASVKYFKKANSVNRKYTQPLVNLSNLYRQLGDEKSQLYYLQKAIKLNPNDYLAYYWFGDYYRKKELYPKAIDNFKESVKINPRFPQVYLSLAMCFFETEEFNYTILALKQYMEFCPNSDYSLFLMSKAALAMCRYDEAKGYVEKAIQINDNREYQLELAKIDYFQENYINALNIFQKILQDGDNAEVFNYIALCNYKMKNITAAIANFNRAIELDGLRPIYYYNLAQCYKSLGDKKNYVKYVNTATKITPVNYQDFIDLSYIYCDNSNPNYAINALNNAIKKYPDVKSLYLSKLKIYETIGDNLNYNETMKTIEMRFNKK